MIPLQSTDFPNSPTDLQTAILKGLANYQITPNQLIVRGSTLDHLEELTLDLSNANLSPIARPSSTTEISPPTFLTNHLQIIGSPILIQGHPATLSITTSNATFQIDGPPSNALCNLVTTQNGSVNLSVAHQTLESLLSQLATKAASKHGVKIKESKLSLTTPTPRSLHFTAEITASIFIMSATLSLSGHIDIDENFLQATLSHLTFDGDSMLKSLASSFIQPLINQNEGRVFLFSPYFHSLGLQNFRLNHLSLSTAQGLACQAQF
jgi:hypothetical protein